MNTTKQQLVNANTALPDRPHAITPNLPHAVNNTDLNAEAPAGFETILFGMGCFWGAERLFWKLDGVYSTSVGYSGGFTVNPTYDDTCTGQTGHTEVVKIIYDPSKISFQTLLTHFWQNHDPAQGMRQGNDIGTQYRSAIYTYSEQQQESALQSKQAYQKALAAANDQREISTEIKAASDYYFAETYHQQYLAKNPAGYCGIGGTGVCFPPE